MKKFLSVTRNKWRQYANRMFMSNSDNTHIWYKNIMIYILAFNKILDKYIKNEQPSIIMISSSLQAKIIVFMYSFVTNIDFILISPLFSTDKIVAAITSRRGVNVLLLDKKVETEISRIEREEGISIFKYFKYVDTINSLVDKLESYTFDDERADLNRLFRKGLYNFYNNQRNVAKFITLSPGTSNEPCFINIPYEILFKSMQIMSYFMGLKADDKVTVIADFEYFPGVFTILGFINGLHFVQPVMDIESAEDYVDQFKNSYTKQSIVVITSQKFKLIWDSILNKVYSNRILFILSKYYISSWLSDWFVLKALKKTFGNHVKRIHILNEELGSYCLSILRKSSIAFTSSYGYLEQGNFLAFKEPYAFKHKDFCFKPGGSVLKESIDLFEKVLVKENPMADVKINDHYVGEVIVETKVGDTIRTMESGDLAVEINNIPNQGNRKYIYVIGKKHRYPVAKNSLDLAEKAIKDTILIRDCFLIPFNGGYGLCIEIREELFDLHSILIEEFMPSVKLLIKDLKDNKGLNITGHAILRFNGFKNIAGKLEYYTMM